MPARPWHRGSLCRRPENGPSGTLDRSPKSQIVIIGEPRQIGLRSKKTLRHPKLPAHSAGRPSRPVLLCLTGVGAPGASADAPSVSPLSSSPWVACHPTRLPADLLCLFVAFHLVSSPSPPPNSLQRDPLLGPSLCHHLKTPPTRGHPLPPCRCPAHLAAAVFASIQFL